MFCLSTGEWGGSAVHGVPHQIPGSFLVALLAAQEGHAGKTGSGEGRERQPQGGHIAGLGNVGQRHVGIFQIGTGDIRGGSILIGDVGTGDVGTGDIGGGGILIGDVGAAVIIVVIIITAAATAARASCWCS